MLPCWLWFFRTIQFFEQVYRAQPCNFCVHVICGFLARATAPRALHCRTQASMCGYCCCSRCHFAYIGFRQGLGLTVCCLEQAVTWHTHSVPILQRLEAIFALAREYYVTPKSLRRQFFPWSLFCQIHRFLLGAKCTVLYALYCDRSIGAVESSIGVVVP